MTQRMKRNGLILLGTIILLLVVARILLPAIVEKSLNKQLQFDSPVPTADTLAFQQNMAIMDWHADTLLWNRDFLERSDYGQVDLPRLKEANIGFQMLTVVTKSPKGQNYDTNTTDAPDNITSLAVVQGWPVRTWGSLLERALYQAEKLADAVSSEPDKVRWIKSQADLNAHLATPKSKLAVFLGTEGAHPLEGKLENIDRMYHAGFRMFGITHFFDNKLAGSLHGTSKSGLTEFGKQAIQRFDELETIIDLSHVSEKAAYEVLALSSRPPVVSHTGFRGNCDSPRNFEDALMEKIAEKGGLIAVGLWEGAICDPSPEGVAKAIQYGISLVGADHVALGSDWDGSVTAMPADALPQITQALRDAGVSDTDIEKVLGGNSIAYLKKWLPRS
jgi:membrane dipeptidase